MSQEPDPSRSTLEHLVIAFVVIVVGAYVMAAAVPGFLRARKRSRSTRIIEDLRIIEAPIDQYAIETNKATNGSVNWSDIKVPLNSPAGQSQAKSAAKLPNQPRGVGSTRGLEIFKNSRLIDATGAPIKPEAEEVEEVEEVVPGLKESQTRSTK